MKIKIHFRPHSIYEGCSSLICQIQKKSIPELHQIRVEVAIVAAGDAAAAAIEVSIHSLSLFLGLSRFFLSR